MATLLTSVGTILTAAVGWVGTCAEMIMSTPLLLIPTVMGIGLIGINIIRRFV